MTKQQQEELFNYMSDEHGVMLLETLMSDLEAILEDKWISVDEWEPEEGEEITTFGDFGVDFCTKDSPIWKYGNITHWQPRPKTQRNEKQNDKIDTND